MRADQQTSAETGKDRFRGNGGRLDVPLSEQAYKSATEHSQARRPAVSLEVCGNQSHGSHGGGTDQEGRFEFLRNMDERAEPRKRKQDGSGNAMNET